MIPKRIHPGLSFHDIPTAHLLKVHSKGVDFGQMQKIAASDYVMHAEIKPEKDKSYVHLITTGAGEFYGPNNNADWFNKSASRFHFPKPQPGGKKFKDLKGGLEKYHGTFTKYASVYREHNNKNKGGTPQGEVVMEAYNPAMNRGELIVKLANDNWHDDLEKLANNEPIYFSMGCGVPYDTCSICGNEAPTRNNYCEHLKYNKLGMDKEGNQVFAINDQPHFHDISRVRVPADRIAFGLRKVASSAVEVPYEEDITDLYLPVSVIEKIGAQSEITRAKALEKLSAIEKKIIAKGMTPEESTITEAFNKNEAPEEIVKKMQEIPLDSLLSSLSDAKVMLPPKTFIRVVMKKPEGEIPGLQEMPCALKHVFSDLQGDEDILRDGSYEPVGGFSSSADEVAKDLAGTLSLDDEPIQKRIIVISVKGDKPIDKAANLAVSSTISKEAKLLAKEYAKYQLSFLTSTGSNKYAHLAVLSNQAD